MRMREFNLHTSSSSSRGCGGGDETGLTGTMLPYWAVLGLRAHCCTSWQLQTTQLASETTQPASRCDNDDAIITCSACLHLTLMHTCDAATDDLVDNTTHNTRHTTLHNLHCDYCCCGACKLFNIRLCATLCFNYFRWHRRMFSYGSVFELLIC